METIATVLVVDDHLHVVHSTRRFLELEGFRVLLALDGREALAVLESDRVDLILADVIMPQMDGFELYERVIEDPRWVSIPFIFLTALSRKTDVLHGKELGADDYLVKPFKVQDLLAVVRGKLRRAEKLANSSAGLLARPESAPQVLTLGRLHIEPDQYRVWLNGSKIKLSNTEFLLLECLALQPNKVVPLKELVQATHGLHASYAEASDLLRPMVRSLRRKLGYHAGDMGCIDTVRGVGYRLIPPVAS